MIERHLAGAAAATILFGGFFVVFFFLAPVLGNYVGNGWQVYYICLAVMLPLIALAHIVAKALAPKP